ncbi:MAG: hypothetical protein GY719_12180 [bacterium]|nr:hypothetical protein [bacterium]
MTLPIMVEACGGRFAASLAGAPGVRVAAIPGGSSRPAALAWRSRRASF